MRKDTDDDNDFIISASSLGTFADCQLRWAGDNINKLSRDAYNERLKVADPPRKSIGTYFGTAAHLGSQLLLEEKAAGEKPDFARAVKLASEKLEEDCTIAHNDLYWDQVTKDFDSATEQLHDVIRQVAIRYVPTVNPVLIEAELKALLKPGFKLVGHPDVVVENEDGSVRIDDFKFGNKCGVYIAQVGAYLILVASNYEIATQGGGVLWTKRRGMRSVQRPLKALKYDFDACVNSATKNANDIIDAVERYRAEPIEEKKLWAFSRNPDSKYCTKKTCRLWGTSACDQWIVESSESKEEDALLWAS